jgi:hypothetical protein
MSIKRDDNQIIDALKTLQLSIIDVALDVETK